jgi:hypothetical protein
MPPTYTTPSTNYGIHRVDGSTNVSDVDAAINQAVDDVDARMAGYAEGTLSARSGVAATAGKFYRTTDTGQVFMGTGAGWVEIGVSPWTPGDLKWSWLTADHAGWLLCDGRLVSRTTYAALFAAIGSSVSAGDGSTTFGLPDFRGRTIVMPDGTAGRMADNDTRGASGGLDTVTLTEAEMPVHDHATYGERGDFAGGGIGVIVYDVLGGGTSPGQRRRRS